MATAGPTTAPNPLEPAAAPAASLPDLTLIQRLVLNLRAARARAYVRVVATGRELSWLAFEVGLPILSAAAYVFIYEALGAPPRYTGFVLLGSAMTAYWMNVLWAMASQFYWEKQSGTLEIYFLAPASRVALLLGMASGGIFMSTSRAASTLIAGSFLFGVRYEVVSWPLAILAFVLTLAALYCLGMLFSSVFLMYGREAWHMASALQEPVYLLSGFYFPVRALGFWAAMGASLIPLTLGLDAMRQLMFGAPDSAFLPVGWELLGLAVMTVVYFLLALRSLAAMEHLAKREGRLTLKWQ
ncbi:MAG TPA: ABC transporter permease [Limnochordales bacterium]